ncbi:MAG TPA: hypothetical protein VJ183_19310 [Chloroflexia bacterium]|nr:hypothetical protein [Chloroflexia bacterium]
MSRMLDEELRTYEERKHELLAGFMGKFVLIKGSGILGIFDTQDEAIEGGYDRLGNVPFLAKEIAESVIPEGITFTETIFAPPPSDMVSLSEDGEAWSHQSIP